MNGIAERLINNSDIISLYNSIIKQNGLSVDAEIKFTLLENMLKLYLRVRSFPFSRDIASEHKHALKQLKGIHLVCIHQRGEGGDLAKCHVSLAYNGEGEKTFIFCGHTIWSPQFVKYIYLVHNVILTKKILFCFTLYQWFIINFLPRDMSLLLVSTSSVACNRSNGSLHAQCV